MFFNARNVTFYRFLTMGNLLGFTNANGKSTQFNPGFRMTVGDSSFQTAEQIKKYPSLIHTCLQTAYTRGADTTGLPSGTYAAGIWFFYNSQLAGMVGLSTQPTPNPILPVLSTIDALLRIPSLFCRYSTRLYGTLESSMTNLCGPKMATSHSYGLSVTGSDAAVMDITFLAGRITPCNVR